MSYIAIGIVLVIMFLYFLNSSFFLHTRRHIDLAKDMRKLWSDHAIWTRQVIVSAVYNLPDFQISLDRLMKNQKDIGQAIIPYYGEAAGKALTELLIDHINIAVQIVTDMKANADTAEYMKKWKNNAKDIAQFLSKANPQWSLESMEAMMQEHLSLTAKEAKDIMNGGGIESFDKVHLQLLEMADHLSDGIVAQFWYKFVV
jgi:hypothetical protein